MPKIIRNLIDRLGEVRSVLHDCVRDGMPLPNDIDLSVLDDLRVELAEKEHRLSEQSTRLLLALAAAKLATWVWDPATGEVIWDKRNYEIFGWTDETEPVTQAKFFAQVHPQDAPELMQRLQNSVAGKTTRSTEFRIRRRDDGRQVWIGTRGVVMTRERGRLLMIGVNADITEQKRGDDRMKMLMHEVTHRSKNLMTLVQVIAHQTAASDAAEFADQFADRIAALAASHDLLVHSQWRGVDLDTLIRSQLAHFDDLIDARISLEGPTIEVSASAAQSIGMIIHELATNASKYGALSNGCGTVDVQWRIENRNGEDSVFQLSWTERLGPPVATLSDSGFGSRLIKELPEHEFAGRVLLDRAEAGLIWQLECPSLKVLENDEAS